MLIKVLSELEFCICQDGTCRSGISIVGCKLLTDAKVEEHGMAMFMLIQQRGGLDQIKMPALGGVLA
jgi:hypothetical protein